MTSRGGRVDGWAGAEPWDISARPAMVESHTEQPVDKYGAALSLGEAEDIAARRLRELAIRLGDEDSEDASPDTHGNGAPFDADRHFRSRLAQRIAGQVVVREATAHEPSYPVTEALPLSAFGERFAAISRLPVTFIEQQTLAVVDSAPDAEADQPVVVVNDPDPPEEPVAQGDVGHALRLADLIQEQRALLDRLSGIAVSSGLSALERPMDDLSEPTNADLTYAAASDAEQLFDVGTHSAEPLQEQDDSAAVPVAISAEQLIAALREVVPASSAEGRFSLESRAKVEVGSSEERTVLAAPELASDAASDRPPMIIERARAELTALANGEAANSRAAPSGFVGFISGLSLSVVVGIGLYFAL